MNIRFRSCCCAVRSSPSTESLDTLRRRDARRQTRGRPVLVVSVLAAVTGAAAMMPVQAPPELPCLEPRSVQRRAAQQAVEADESFTSFGISQLNCGTLGGRKLA